LDWIGLAAVTTAPSAAFPLSLSTHVKLDPSVSVSVSNITLFLSFFVFCFALMLWFGTQLLWGSQNCQRGKEKKRKTKRLAETKSQNQLKYKRKSEFVINDFFFNMSNYFLNLV
jgi:hypothetical protein